MTNYNETLEGYVSLCTGALESVSRRYFRASSRVSEAAEYSLMNGGKRVRGVLTLATCEMLGGRAQDAVDFAAAIEMVHSFSLIHDDLPCMDDDDTRRGKPSCHKAFGQANALLAGDLLSLEAFEVIAGADLPADTRIEATRVLASGAGARGMIYGQELDMEYEQKYADGQALEQIHIHKTGALILAAVQLGVLAAGRSPRQEAAISEYADGLGYVFQIVDDVLDVTADEAALGKPVGSDAENGKTTYVTLYGLEESKNKARQLTTAAVRTLSDAYGDKAAFLCAYAQSLSERAY